MTKQKQWNIGTREDPDGAIAALARCFGFCYPTACLLYARGYRTEAEVSSFLNLETEMLRNPFELRDMEAACLRLAEALEKGEQIVVYGDYDVDGVTATSLLCLYLQSKGGRVEYYIPNRVGEGYGIRREALEERIARGVTLVVTVDTGITAVEEVAYAESHGCDVIVTDHHECQAELPPALAVVNPKRADCTYPFKELAGVGVAFKLVTGLEAVWRRRRGIALDGFLEELCYTYMDLVALGTVADVMPLRDENRLIVSMGLRLMEKATRPGLRALMAAADGGKNKQRRRVTTSTVGFSLAPRINAAGRIDSASRAVELFLTDDEEVAKRIAEELCEINRRRQYEENKIVEEIQKRIAQDPSIAADDVIVLADDHWNQGVIGIVASRITEKYGKPSILISFEGEVGKGSGRSVKGLNLVEALVHCSDTLQKYGGHEMAAGLTVLREQFDAFRQRINAYARERLGECQPTVTLDVDCELYPSEISLRLAEELGCLEPCGIANPVPQFLLSSLTVSEVVPIGQKQHSKLILKKDDKSFTALYFGVSPEEMGYAPGDLCDIVFQLSVNEYMGRKSEQLVIRDMRLTEEGEARLVGEEAHYRAVLTGEGKIEERDFPKREDFVGLYLHLKRRFSEAPGLICLHALLHELNGMPSPSGVMTYTRLRLCLDILNESGILTLQEKNLTRPAREVYTVSLNHVEQKVNLEKSCIYKRLMTSV